MDYPTFETRSDAENYCETLYMQGYERSFGYDIVVQRCENGYEVIVTRCPKFDH